MTAFFFFLLKNIYSKVKSGKQSSKDASSKTAKTPPSSPSGKKRPQQINKPEPWWKKAFCCFKKKNVRARSSESGEPTDEQLLAAALGVEEPIDPPLIILPEDVKAHSKQFEDSLFPNILESIALAMAKKNAAIQIQRIARGYFARRLARKKMTEAIAHFSKFWESKKKEREDAKDLLKKEKQFTHKVLFN